MTFPATGDAPQTLCTPKDPSRSCGTGQFNSLVAGSIWSAIPSGSTGLTKESEGLSCFQGLRCLLGDLGDIGEICLLGAFDGLLELTGLIAGLSDIVGLISALRFSGRVRLLLDKGLKDLLLEELKLLLALNRCRWLLGLASLLSTPASSVLLKLLALSATRANNSGFMFPLSRDLRGLFLSDLELFGD